MLRICRPRRRRCAETLGCRPPNPAGQRLGPRGSLVSAPHRLGEPQDLLAVVPLGLRTGGERANKVPHRQQHGAIAGRLVLVRLPEECNEVRSFGLPVPADPLTVVD